jgi:hypothetical protein
MDARQRLGRVEVLEQQHDAFEVSGLSSLPRMPRRSTLP